MNYVSILSILILISGFTMGDVYSYLDFYMTENMLKEIAVSNTKSIAKLSVIDNKNETYTEKIWVVDLILSIKNIKSETKIMNTSCDVTTNNKSDVTANCKSAFELQLSFNTTASIGGISIGKGIGHATVGIENLVMSYLYSSPKFNIIIDNITVKTSNVQFPTGIFADAIKAVIAKKFDMNIAETLKSKIVEVAKGINPLEEWEKPNITLNGENLEIGVNSVNTKHSGKTVTRLSNGEMLNKIFSKNCTSIDEHKNETYKVCICDYVFAEIAISRALSVTIKPEQWYLKGKVMELYGILPELINEYPPDEDFTINRVMSDIQKEGTEWILTYVYKFIIQGDSVLDLTTKFNADTKSNNDKGSLNMMIDNLKINKMQTSKIVQPAGRTVLGRFMQYEFGILKGKIFDGGMTIPKNANVIDYCYMPATTKVF